MSEDRADNGEFTGSGDPDFEARMTALCRVTDHVDHDVMVIAAALHMLDMSTQQWFPAGISTVVLSMMLEALVRKGLSIETVDQAVILGEDIFAAMRSAG